MKFQEARRRTRRFGESCRATANAKVGFLIETTHPSRRLRREMHRMLVVGIEPIVIQIDGNDVIQWYVSYIGQ